MKINICLTLLACLLSLLSGCRDDAFRDYSYKQLIAVEGWIESGEYARVKLTITASLQEEYDKEALLAHALRSAKVTVSNGRDSEILGLETDNDHIPPYVYYGSVLKGEPGKTYTLTVEAGSETVRAETYVPEPLPLEGLHFQKAHPDDTTGYLHISFLNTAPDGVYYQVLTKVNQLESVFYPCLYGNIDRKTFAEGELVTIQINKGPILYPEPSFRTEFPASNSIDIKFRTQPKHGYDFWTSWENEVINIQNPIFPANTSLRSNITGGVGIWCGYGTYNYTVVP